MTAFELPQYLTHCQALVDATFDRILPHVGTSDPGRLKEAMRYAVLEGGKRMRPIVAIAACEAVGGSIEDALPAACAIELVHSYSLVHDDLPAMDNDLERRGRPTVHVAFGHANAILTGDALLTFAFESLVRESAHNPKARAAEAVGRLAHHAGIEGMVGGQAMDLALGQDVGDLETLEKVHALKTGGLYAAAAAMGGLMAGAASAEVTSLERWGLLFGIAFQHADDVLDDDQPAVRAQALARVEVLVQACRDIARSFAGRGQALLGIADWVAERTKAASHGAKLD